ncbi:mechanosensitive ion channel family protein [Roseateles sp. DC23W]|uniref:Mechanosensitive ion channel family protein n=1 Tax=Pelomonas dachongensis TaxID=3299029 RepID=A0ABW7EUI3_9BURK
MTGVGGGLLERGRVTQALYLILVLFLCVLGLAFPGEVRADSPATAASAPATGAARVPVTPADILLLAAQDQRFADRLRRQLARPDPAQDLLASLAALDASVEEKLRAFGADALAELPIARLESLDRHWKFDARRFAQWQADAQRKLMPFDDAAAQVARRRQVWEATRASAVLDQLPPAMLERVDVVLAALDQVRQDLAAPLARQVELSRRADALAAQIETGSAEVEDAIALIDRRLLAVDAPPLWALPARAAAAPEGEEFSRGMEIEAQFARDYVAAAPVNRRALLVLQPLLLMLMLLARHRSRDWPADASDDRAALHRPIAAWLLLSMMSVLVLEPEAPLLAHQVALLIALVPLLRLLPTRRQPVLDHWPLVAVGLYVLNFAALVPSATGIGYRFVHLGLTLLALGLTLWLLWRSHRPVHDPSAARAVRVARAAAWCAAALLGTALVMNVVGNVSLADMLLGGVIESGYFGLLLYATVGVARALLRALLDETFLQPLPLLQRHSRQLFGMLSRALVAGAAVGGLAYAMTAFRVMRPAQGALTAMLGYHFEVGEISVSLGDLLVFALSVLIAWWVARAVRQVLGEQLSARPSLPRGVANSVASLSYYAVLLLGFLLALSAAGFKVSQLALVFGALGVGIGFGLQNIVNNFVSGLVLMFERPLRPGDVVEVAGAAGRVQAIGMRATIIRTFDGAEVVVPNGTLLSSSLTNWTLVDHSRRIEIEVGVVYGTEPAQVLALLQAVALATPGVAAQPAPSALMKGYGDSSLDFVLRAWTTDFDNWTSIRSAMLVNVNTALGEAGIQIPFNQYDLNLRSVSGEALAVLRPEPPGALPDVEPLAPSR